MREESNGRFEMREESNGRFEMREESKDKLFRTKISFEWEAIDGTDSGSAVISNAVVNRQARLAMQEALTNEIIRWGKAALRAHGFEPMPVEK